MNTSTTIPHAEVLGTAGAGTFDYFEFNVAATSLVILDIDSSPNTTNFDTHIHLFDSLGNPIASSDDNNGDPGDGGGIIGGAFNSRIETTLTPGDYVIGVASFPSSASAGGVISGPGAGSSFTLNISAPQAGPEPGTLVLLGVGAAYLGVFGWRRARRKAAV